MFLRRLQENDAEGMLDWMNDPDIQKNFRIDMGKRNRDDVLQFIRAAQTEPEDGKSIHYAVADEDNRYLGTISLKNVNLIDNNAEYAISMRKCAQGRGIATAATKEILRLAFEEFDLKRVYLNVLSTNSRAIHLYEKSGFIYEGEFRDHLFLNGKYYTLKWYGMLKEDYDTLKCRY